MSRRRDLIYDSDAILMAATDKELRAYGEALRQERSQGDPVGWMNERLGAFAWSTQQEIALSVLDHRHTAVPACHDSGKSWIGARLAGWWIDTHPPGEAFVVTSAPTGSQVRAILWREMHQMHSVARLPGVMNQTEWLIDGHLVALGRKPSDYDDAAFQGIHARHVLVILDEASGIAPSLWTAAETLIANEGSRLLAIGNPDDPMSPFAKACRPNSGWNVIGIAAFDTPNFTDEEVPDSLRPLLVSPTWVDERRARWGEGSALWTAKVLGEFPDRSDDSLIHLSWVQRAGDRTLPAEGEACLGVDVARRGSSETVIVLRRGGVARCVHARVGDDTMRTTGEVIRAVRTHGAVMAKVDDVGVGGGVVDRLREQKQPAVGLNAGHRPRDRQRFVNARAEWYWELRERFEHGEIDIDPDDEVLAEQLCSIRYGVDSAGRIQIESKEEMRARGMASPDRADALALAFAEVELRRRARVTQARIIP
jgi:hypothetical protein